jgi:hypothetical protein
MTKLFSAFGAAGSLEKDRQTVRRALRGVAPDGHENGQPRWRLTTILRALDRHLGRSEPSPSVPMHLATLYSELDRLYDKVNATKTVAAAREIMRLEFFPMLVETTRGMFAIADDDRFIYVIEHERTQLAVCRKACGWSIDQMMAEYNKATRPAELDEIDGDDDEEIGDDAMPLPG